MKNFTTLVLLLVLLFVLVISSTIFCQTKISSQDVIPFFGSKNESTQTNWRWPDIRLSFMKLNKDGYKVFNGWSLLCPIQIEFPRIAEESIRITISIPFEYARLFDQDKNSDQALRIEDYPKASKFISNELQKQLKNALQGFEMNKEVYRLNHPIDSRIHHFEIINFHAEGFASPEGPQLKGFMTLENGAIDIQNLALADRRAHACLGYTASFLASDGFTQMADTLNAHSKEWGTWISVEELQLSIPEWKVLDSVASMQGYIGHSITERVWHAVIAYNNGAMGKSAKVIFDRIVGSKRSVTITFDLAGKNNNITLIPIPWLLLLLLIPAFHRKNKNIQDRKSTQPEYDFVPGKELLFDEYYIPETKGFIVVDTKPIQTQEQKIEEKNIVVLEPVPLLPKKTPEEKKVEPKESLLKDIPDIFWNVILPDPLSIEYMEMEEATIVDDLWVYWKETDYGRMCDHIQYGYDSASQESREIYFTYQIIKLWETIDGIQYKNNGYQICWARMHARLLIKIVDIKRGEISKGNLFDYWTILNDLAHTLHKRRVERRKRSC